VKGIAIQAAIFDGNVAPGLFPDPSPKASASNEFNRHGTHWALRPAEGALIAAEISYRFNQPPEEELSATRTSADARLPGHPVAPASPQRGLAGSYKAGILVHTDEFSDVYDVALLGLRSTLAPSIPRDRGKNYGIYVNIEQEIWRERGSETNGLGAFAHAAWMPNDRNQIEFSIEGGLHYRGPFRGRDDDAIGLGLAFLKISDRVASAVRDSNRADRASQRVPDYEATMELVYRYQVEPWFSIQPHLQYVIHPGGTNERDNALIIGIRSNVTF
jgi:porin